MRQRCFGGLREKNNSFYGKIHERIKYAMTKRNYEKNLRTKIHMLEDELLRCKDYRKVDSIRAELAKQRVKLQRMKFQRMGS